MSARTETIGAGEEKVKISANPEDIITKLSSQASKNPLVRSYLQVPKAAGQVKLWMISNVN